MLVGACACLEETRTKRPWGLAASWSWKARVVCWTVRTRRSCSSAQSRERRLVQRLPAAPAADQVDEPVDAAEALDQRRAPGAGGVLVEQVDRAPVPALGRQAEVGGERVERPLVAAGSGDRRARPPRAARRRAAQARRRPRRSRSRGRQASHAHHPRDQIEFVCLHHFCRMDCDSIAQAGRHRRRSPPQGGTQRARSLDSVLPQPADVICWRDNSYRIQVKTSTYCRKSMSRRTAPRRQSKLDRPSRFDSRSTTSSSRRDGAMVHPRESCRRQTGILRGPETPGTGRQGIRGGGRIRTCVG